MSTDSSHLEERIRQLEEALHQSQGRAQLMESRLEQLVNHLQEGVLLVDNDGHITLLNDRFCELWNLSLPSSGWVGRRWQDIASAMLVLAANEEEFIARVHELRERAQPVFNEPVELRDGRVLERDFIPVKQIEGIAARTLVRLRDATDYHRAAKQLRAVASIPSQNPNPILRIDVEGQVVYSNPAADMLYTSLPENDQSRLRTKVHRLAASALAQNQSWQVDVPVGEGFYAAFVAPFPEEGYANIYLVNITKRILAEQAVHQAKDEAEAAVRVRENFLANVSHEIRTPMNGILGMALQLSKTPLAPRQQDFVRIIRTSGQHLLSVINDVLDMAKISSGNLELEQTPFNLCDSMAEALQPLIMQATEKGITVTGTRLSDSCPLPWVAGDPYRLNQVLINLMANAVKFTEPGGHINVVGKQLDATDDILTVEFSVADTGLGIPFEQQERIFEGFTQAYADTTRRFGGTGLGLSISKAIVEQLGGTLTVESEVGLGSTFRFVVALPRTTATEKAESSASFDTGALQGKRILLVEDNEINRDVARMLLEEWGVRVDEAESGHDGIQLFQQNSYDAILMDIQMPGMSGLEATAIIRKSPDPLRAAIPIMALTANALRADSVRYLAAGMNACLTKPFEEADLYHQLEQLLRPSASPEAVRSYDLTKLRALSHGRDTFVVKIIKSFLANIPASIVQLQEAAAASDWTRVAAIVHHIKPGVESLGIVDVNESLQLLQQEAPAIGTEQPARQATVSHVVNQIQRALLALPQELPADSDSN